MSTMMQTQNPEAHARMMANAPMPGVGDTVVYHLRPGQMRAGYTHVPAMVLKVDAGNRLLTLLALYDQQDMQTLTSVPERIGEDHGWVARENDTAGLRREIADLRERVGAAEEALDAFKQELAAALFGEHEKPELSLLDQVAAISHRVDRMASAPAANPANKAAKATSKRK